MSAAQIKITIELEYKSGVRKLSESLVIPEEWSHMEADNMGTVEWQRVVDLTQIMDRRNGKDRLCRADRAGTAGAEDADCSVL